MLLEELLEPPELELDCGFPEPDPLTDPPEEFEELDLLLEEEEVLEDWLDFFDLESEEECDFCSLARSK